MEYYLMGCNYKYKMFIKAYLNKEVINQTFKNLNQKYARLK